MMVCKQQAFDIVVVGSGIVGMSVALAAAQQNFSVLLLERAPKISFEITKNFDSRVYAINKASQRLFEKLLIWDSLKAKRVTPYQKMYVWEDETLGHIEFEGHSIGMPEIGYIIEDMVLKNVIFNACLDESRLAIAFSTEIVSFHETNGMLIIDTKTGSTIRTQLLVAADGADSWVRQTADIAINEQHYEQTAIVANICTEISHQYCAWQRFMKHGPLALLPLSNENYCSIVWSNDTKRSQQLMEMSPEAFSDELAQRFENKLGSVNLINKRKQFPLVMRHAQHYIGNRIALVGDAMHTIHPLAGQGLNLGLSDVTGLIDVIKKAHEHNQDIGSRLTLRRYERSRKFEVIRMIKLMSAFHHGFTNEYTLLRQLRNRTLNFVNHVKPLKHLFLKAAVQ